MTSSHNRSMTSKRLALLALVLNLGCASAPSAPGEPSSAAGPAVATCPAPPPPPATREQPAFVLQEGHTSQVLDLALSARGHILASSGMDGTVRVWDTRTGLLLRKVATQGVTLALSLSASGEVLAFQKTDLASGPTVATVDLARGGEPRSLGETGSFMLSPDGKVIAVAFNGLRLYDARTGAKLHDFDPLPSPKATPPAYTRPVFEFDPHTLRAAAFDPTGRRLAVASAFEIGILDVATRKILRRTLFSPFSSAETAPAAMTFTEDVLVIMDASRRIHALGVAEGSRLISLPGIHSSAAVAGGRLITPDASQRLGAWDLATGARADVPALSALRATRLGMSADGSTLALTTGASRELRVVDGRTWKPLRSIESHTLPVHAVSIRPDGAALVTSVEGGAIGRWNLQTGELVELSRAEPGAGAPRVVHDDSGALVAYVSGGLVRVHDARSGLLLRRWSAGSSIVAAWFAPSARELVTLGDKGAVMGWVLAPSVDPAPRTASPTAEIAKPNARALGAATGPVTAAAVSPDRTRLIVATGDRMLTVPDPSAPGKWKWAYTEARLELSNLENGATIWDIGVTTGYPSKWLAFAPDGKSVLLSSNQDPREIPPRATSVGELRDQQILRVFDGATGGLTRTVKASSMGPIAVQGDVVALGGREAALLSWPDLSVRARVPVPDYLVQAIAPHPRRKLFVFGGDSGAASLVSATTGEVTAILAAAEGGEYITATREGAFRASLDGARGVGWTFGAPLEGFSFEQFSARFDLPDVVARALTADEAPKVPAVARPPSVRAEMAGATSARSAPIRVHVGSPRWVERVRVFAEGRAAADALVCAPEKDLTIDVPLAAGQNRLTVIAYDADGFASNPATLNVTLDAPGAARPNLWAVAIGVSRYAALGPEHQLDFADDDARSIAAALAKLAGPGRRFAELRATTLLDAQVTPESVQRSIEALAAMSPDDLAVVFLAGHGVQLDKGKMVYLTSGASMTRDGARAHGVGWDVIRAALGQARGRVLLLLDACHSGHVSTEIIAPNEALAKELAAEGRAGVLVFAAARGAQLSYEVPAGVEGLAGARGLTLAWEGKPAGVASAPAAGHGLFTSALLEGLAGEAADRDRSGAIEVGELIDYVTERVREASNGKQTPWVARREMFGDFVIAPAPGR